MKLRLRQRFLQKEQLVLNVYHKGEFSTVVLGPPRLMEARGDPRAAKPQVLTHEGPPDTLRKMDQEELYVTASLAQLELSETEAQVLSQAVEEMLQHFARMREINVDGLEPTTHALLKTNRVRTDVVVESLLADRLLENAPETEDRFIVIPNVL